VIVAAILVAAVAFVVVVAVLPAPAKKVPSKERPAVNVTVLPIRPIARFRDNFVLPGSVEPNRTVRVSAEVAGRIEKILCQEGRPCGLKDKLVLLNTDLLKAEFDQAEAAKEFDRREVSRTEDAAARGVATANELDQARTKYAASLAALSAAKARLDRAEVLAPIAGVLNHLPVEVGEYVSPGMPVAEIVDIDTVLVVVDVPERDIRHLKVGDSQEIRADALGNERFTGKIRYISQLADQASRTTRVEIEVDNTHRRLRSGQIVTAHLLRRVLDNVIMIPMMRSVIPLEKGYRVYVVKDGKAQPRDVKLGFFKGRNVRVMPGSGLAAGDLLITDGHRYVGPSQPVSIRNGWDGPPASAPADANTAAPGGAP
jgi:membrane fusion protein (multidrug efflux system)